MSKDVITIGDAMITFNPITKGPMRNSHYLKEKSGEQN